MIAVLALAGPSWRQSAQPLWQSRTPLVIALDLSTASLAADLPPSRLAQARAKLAVLLRERSGGEVGLVAFAADAFTVAPLTDDAANVALFLDALAPDVMPRDGQGTGEAIAWSAQLLKRAGATSGDIVLLTDRADSAAISAAAEAARLAIAFPHWALGLDPVRPTVAPPAISPTHDWMRLRCAGSRQAATAATCSLPVTTPTCARWTCSIHAAPMPSARARRDWHGATRVTGCCRR